MSKQRRGAVAAGGLLLAVLAGGAACTPDRSNTRIEVIVNVDSRLVLDEVAMTLAADGRQELQKSMPVTGSGDASIDAAIAPISWQVAIANAAAPMRVTATARGRKANATTVTAIAKVDVSPGDKETVVLTLSAACMGVTCGADQTCMASGTTGMCVTIPVTGQPDGGAGDTADTRRADAADARPDGDAASTPDTGAPDSGGPDGGMPDAPPKITNGGACAAHGDCMSTHCVDGVCCNEACTDVCTACKIALTVSAPDGTCAPVASGRDDPGGRCGTTLPETCGTTGHCDGAGACERFGSNTTCQSASCGGGNFTPAGTCSGTGDCVPGAVVNCQGFACSATTGCATTCTSDANCTGGYCTAAMTCAAKKTNGSTCAGNNECTSMSCVGGVCCEDACAGLCMSCTMAETGQNSGLCRPISAGGSSRGRCTVAGTACGLDGTCNGTGACRYPASGTSCAAAACSGNTFTSAAMCNGSGACAPGVVGACASNFTCASATACRTSCAVEDDCVSTAYCNNGACTAKKTNGSTCGAGRECANGVCSPDGICCNRACTNSCEACDNAGSVGTCSPVASGPAHGNRAQCAGTGTCAGTCANRSDGLCSYPTVSCGSASCSGQQLVPAGTCSAGTCVAGTPQNCANGYACAANACRTSCDGNADCRSDHFCTGGTCHRDVVSIATADYHTCAVLGDGRVYCWGANVYGQLLGGGTTSEVFNSPIQITGVTNAAKVALELQVSCVMTTSGGVTCWGQGDIGDGMTASGIKPPTTVVTNTGAALTGVTGLSAGGINACASTATNLYCWGVNLNHQLGVTASTSAPSEPVRSATPVIGAGSPRSLGMGAYHQVAQFNNGSIVCPWGANNDYRQITSSSCTQCGRATDFCFDAGATILQVAAGGGSSSCARYQAGILCWGDNTAQQLGTLDTSAFAIGPPGIQVSLSAIDMQVYQSHVCVLLTDGVPTIKCWGGQYAVQDPIPPPYTAPVTIPVSFPAGVKAASLGEGTGATTCLIATDGSPWCFGRNFYGQVGNSASGSATPVGTATSPTITW